MIQLRLIHVLAVAVSIMKGYYGDYHHGDYTSYANYYPEYSSIMKGYHGDYHHGDYTSYANYYPEYSFNYSAPTISNRQKRIFSDDIFYGIKIKTTNDSDYILFSEMSVVVSLDGFIPLQNLCNTCAILFAIPIIFSLPAAASTKSDGYRTRRSLSSAGPSRSSMYKTLEGYVAKMTGSDGHACLLRAMCETSATPLHDDGLIGENAEGVN